MTSPAHTPAKVAKHTCPECKMWREAVVALIKSLPQPNRQLVCAKLATIPAIWESMDPSDRTQAALIVAKADTINRTQEAAPELLEALKDVLRCFVGDRNSQNCAGESGQVADKARAALARAEGGKE